MNLNLTPLTSLPGQRQITVPEFLAGVSASLRRATSETTRGYASYSTGGPSPAAFVRPMDKLQAKVNVGNAFTLAGVRFQLGGEDHVVKSGGDIQRTISPVTGIGTKVGTLTAALGQIELTAWPVGGSCELVDFRGLAAAPVNGPDSPYSTYTTTFRVATAPLRPNGFSVLGTMLDGTTFNLVADANGYINAARIKGRVNYATGVVQLVGVSPTGDTNQTQVDLAFLGIPGVGLCFIDLILQETLRYNAVAYSYLPMDASLLGINPVRLPSDGRVPIFRPGSLVVVTNEQTRAAAAVGNGQTVNLGRTRLSRVVVIGADKLPITTGYEADLEAGTVHFTTVAGYSQPVTISHRVEDMSMLRDAQIDGTLVMLRALTHDYAAGTTYIASAFAAGDLKARVSRLFDMQSWDNTSFEDSLGEDGEAALGTFNDVDHPILVTNAGALTERWAIQFTSSTAFRVIGEGVGVITVGSTGDDCAPINTRTGEPYFVIPESGWGTGWVPGNVLRFDTVGAQAPLWLVRTIQQGPEAGSDYTFELLARGDVDNPI
jgi:hypothetical protein